MLNIDELKARSGMSSLSSESWGGGVSGEFRNTYDKIMKSGYSANTHLIAAESIINEVIVDEFTDSLMVANLAQESKILSIINPLANSASSEANNIYYRICEVLGTEGKENIADKASAVGTKIWNTIKEAFRKLRLAFTNIMAGIRKAISGALAGDFTNEYRQYDTAVKMVRGDERIGNRTIKMMAASTEKVLNTDSGGLDPDTVKRFTNQMKAAVERMESDAKNIINKNQINSINEDFKVKYEKDFANTLFSISGGNKRAESRWKNEKGSLVKILLYGRDGRTLNMKYKNIFKQGAEFKKLLDPNFKNNMESALKDYDGVIRSISNTINEVERYTNQYRDKEGKFDAEKRRIALKQLQNMRQIVSKLAPISKDIFVEAIRLRVKIGNLVKNILKGAGTTTKEQNRTDKELRRNAKNNSGVKNITAQ